MNILLSKRAEKTYLSIREYIIEDFGERVADVFEDKVTDFLELIKIFPLIGSVEEKKQTDIWFSTYKANQDILSAQKRHCDHPIFF